jgi:hypothetical protein
MIGARDGVIGEPFGIVTRSQLARLVTLNASELRLWLVLAVRVSGRDRPWWIEGGIGALAVEAGISERAAWRAVAELVRVGLLAVQPRSTKAGRTMEHAYVVIRPPPGSDTSVTTSEDVIAGELRIAPPETGRRGATGGNSPDTGVTPSPDTGVRASPDTGVRALGEEEETSKEIPPSPPAGGTVPDPELAEVEIRDALRPYAGLPAEGELVTLDEEARVRALLRAVNTALRVAEGSDTSELPERLLGASRAFRLRVADLCMARAQLVTEVRELGIRLRTSPADEYSREYLGLTEVQVVTPRFHACGGCGRTWATGEESWGHACGGGPWWTGGVAYSVPAPTVDELERGGRSVLLDYLTTIPDASVLPVVGRARDRAAIVDHWCRALHAVGALDATALGRTHVASLDPSQLAARARELAARRVTVRRVKPA